MNINKTLMSGFLGAVLVLASVGSAQADGVWSYPAIQGYGPVHVTPGAALMPDKSTTYKAVFDVTQVSKDPAAVSAALDHVARTVNVFAAAGVPLDHLKLVVIVHGPATLDVLDDAEYQARLHSKNPNLAVIAALRKAGVQVLVCGNAIADMKIDPSQLDPDVSVALSALSTLVILQNQGYALISL